jgi:hypothetical protein
MTSARLPPRFWWGLVVVDPGNDQVRQTGLNPGDSFSILSLALLDGSGAVLFPMGRDCQMGPLLFVDPTKAARIIPCSLYQLLLVLFDFPANHLRRPVGGLILAHVERT